MDEKEGFERLKAVILAGRGLDVSQYKENYLKRRLAVRMRALQIKEYSAYAALLEKDPREFDTLMDKLTINVTQFFRDPEVFGELENSVLAGLFEQGKGRLRVWSAGCSSGEEPYSIAISVMEAAEKAGIGNLDLEIHATDIDNAVLFKAVSGKYEGRTLDNVPEARKKKYFNFDGKNYIIRDEVRQKVRFIRANLMEPYKHAHFDMVFCRNVIIYFSRELQKKVIGFFYDALKPGGYFFMGKTETMLMEMRDRFECVNIKERIFRKTEGKLKTES